MKKSLFSTKAIVATAIGAALFYVLAKLAIPSGIPNTTLALQYGVLSFFSALFGPVCGALVGFIGHWLNDLTAGWGVWWTWVVASAVTGLISGLVFNKIKLDKGKFGKKEFIKYALYNLVAYAVSWLVLAPAGDVFIYNEPTDKLMLQASFSFIADYLVALVIGGLLCYAYAKTIAKPNSLDKE